MQRLGVVHLVWGPLGIQPLRSFLLAYKRHAAGVEHELIVAFNGVAGDEERRPGEESRAALLRELEGVKHRLLELPRAVQDLEAYFMIANSVEHDRLCFLNSHSEPLVDGWLERLAQCASRSGVGAAGATASWASQSSHARCLAGLGGPYASVYDDLELVRGVFAPHASLASDLRKGDDGRKRSTLAQSVQRVRSVQQLVQELRCFPPFPAPHLRTNAFLLERRLMLRLTGRTTDKTGAYRLESGRRSLTRRIEQSGLRALVAGRDGIAYDSRDWPSSQTFWQGSQQNLIIADNQTRAYEAGDFAVRRVLSAHAWGKQAKPAMPSAPEAVSASGGADQAG